MINGVGQIADLLVVNLDNGIAVGNGLRQAVNTASDVTGRQFVGISHRGNFGSVNNVFNGFGIERSVLANVVVLNGVGQIVYFRVVNLDDQILVTHGTADRCAVGSNDRALVIGNRDIGQICYVVTFILVLYDRIRSSSIYTQCNWIFRVSDIPVRYDDIVLVLAGVLHLNGQASQRNTGGIGADKFQFSSVRFQRNGEIRNAVVGRRSGAFRNGVVNAVGKAHGRGAVFICSLIGSFLLPVHSEHCAFQRIAVSIDLFNADTGNRFRRIDIFNGLFAFFHRQLIGAAFQIIRVKFGFAHFNVVDFYAFQFIASRCVFRCGNSIRLLGEFSAADQCVSKRLGRTGHTLRKAAGCYFQRTDFDYRSRYRELEGLLVSLFVLIVQNSGFVQRNVDAVAFCAGHGGRIQLDLVGHCCTAGYIRAGVPVDGFVGDIHRGLRRRRQRRGGVQRSGGVGNIRLLGDQVHHAAHDVGNCTVVDDPQNGVQNIVEDAAKISAYCIVVFVAAGSDVGQTFNVGSETNRIQLKIGFVAVFDGSRTFFCRSGSISAILAGIGTVFAVYVRLTVGQQDHKFLVGGAAVAFGIEGFVSLNQACLDIGAAGASLPVTAVDAVTVKPIHFAGVDGSFNGINIGGVGRAIFIENRGQSQLLLAKAAELHNADSGINAFGDQRIDQCHL